MRSPSVNVALALVLAACAGPKIEQGPTLKDLAKRQKSEAEEIQAAPTPAPQASPQTALENYKRIADLATDPATKIEANRRLADLQIQLEETQIADDSTEAKQRDSITRYQKLLDERPTEKTNDRVLYQLSRAHQNVGDWKAAAATLKQLTDQYPASRYAGDAHFRRAELLFRIGEYTEAVNEYTQVLALGTTTAYFEPAQYKYGWAQFKLNNYAEALKVFFGILDRELPPGEATDAKAAIAGVAQAKRDVAQDALRVVSLAFISLGGGEEVAKYSAQNGEPRFYPLVYLSLGDALLERKRYSDAAKAFAAFQKSHSGHALAPAFQSRVIAAYKDGGFGDQVLQEKERYALTYEPSAAYWSGRAPSPEILGELRQHLDDIGRFYHARAQKGLQAAQAPPPEPKPADNAPTDLASAGPVAPAEPPPAPPSAEQIRADFMLAAKWYRRTLDVFPQDKSAAEVNFLLADALLEGGKTLAAAREYNKTATSYPEYARAGDAAHAAVFAFHKYAEEVPAAQKPAALKQAIAASLRFADGYGERDEVGPVLVRAAEDLYQIKQLDPAVRVAERALQLPRPLTPELQLTAWSVAADAEFVQKRWPKAEAAYVQVLERLPVDAGERGKTLEQLAAAIYKQAEAARDANALREAVQHFQRVGVLTPGSTIRVNADYDAATALMALKDWTAAIAALEDFRKRYPNHALQQDVDKKLAVAYQNGNRPELAAAVLQRIAQSANETAETRQEAAWSAAQLLEGKADHLRVAEAYKSYLDQFPQPLDRAMQARQKLADLAQARGETQRRQFWLEDMVAADAAAGAARTDPSRAIAARAALELARLDARDANRVALKPPLNKSVPVRKKAVEKAIAALSKAAEYGFAEVSTAATFELGSVYQNFGRALLDSDRPRGLSDLEREQYDLLLEEQAFPFEEKAIQWHEANLKLIGQGVYDEFVGKSAEALARLAPGRYGKREQGEEIYRALR